MTHSERIHFARQSLKGLSMGDAFGDSFFGDSDQVQQAIQARKVPQTSKWEFTDDTVMAIALVENLEQYQQVHQEQLAQLFARNYLKDINRGYGGTAHRVLREIGEGNPWQNVSAQVFDGQGSMGNGAAMRVAPLGAYFHDQPDLLLQQAAQSAEVTHFHHEAKVGAAAIALAASVALSFRLAKQALSAEAFLTTVHNGLANSDTKSKIGKALHIPKSYRIETATAILGNGTKLLAQDTVPFALWCAAHYLDNFEEALWTAVSGLGDRDTIGAMVGSIVILYADEQTIPVDWIVSVEDVEQSVFRNGIR